MQRGTRYKMATGYFHHVPAEQMRHFPYLARQIYLHIIAEIEVDLFFKGVKNYTS